MNTCAFSADRLHRYSLLHVMQPGGKRIAWIGLNPSTADEHRLDPTLARVRKFSLAHGYDEFVMLNLFSFRATVPQELRQRRITEPEMLLNGMNVRSGIRSSAAVVFAWGATFNQWPVCAHEMRAWANTYEDALCLGHTKAGFPKHPLYVRGDTKLVRFKRE